MKLVLAIGVVFVHFPYPGVIGNCLSSIGTSGVIVFFLISGYACYKDEENSNGTSILRRTKRTALITGLSVLIYLLFTIIEQLCYGTIGDWAAKFTDPWLFPRMIVLGDFEFIHADHLWFLVGLLYGYLIMYVIERFKLRKLALILTPFLVLLRIAMETITNSMGLDWHLSGNFLVGALPMLLLGYCIHIKEEELLKIEGGVYIGLTLSSLILLFLFVNFKVFDTDISQVFKILTASLIFLTCLKYPRCLKDNPFSRFGREGSLYIYIDHYLIGVLLTDIFVAIGMDNNFRSYALPFIVLGASLLISYLIYLGKLLVLKKRKEATPVGE